MYIKLTPSITSREMESNTFASVSSKLYNIYKKKKGNKEKSSVVFYKALRVSPPDLYRARSVSGYLAVLLNKILLLVFTGSARRIRLAAEGELVAVFRLSCFHFLVPICFFPAAYESGHHCQCGQGDKNHNSNHP